MIRQTISRNLALTALVWCWTVGLASATPRRQTEATGRELDVVRSQPGSPILRSVPSTIAFQGFLTDASGSPINANVSLVLALYNQESGGPDIWAETPPDSVPVSDGVFNIDIGGTTPLSLDDFDGSTLWLGIGVNGEAELPRTRLQTSPFAFRAAISESVEALVLDDLADVDVSGALVSDVLQFDGANWLPGTVAGGGPDGDWTIADPDMYSAVLGNVGIGTSAPSHKLHVAGDLRASKATIGTGLSNAGDFSTIAAGTADTIGTGTSMFIGGGEGNVVQDGAHWSGILAGRDNRITERWSFVGAGQANSAHIYAGIGAGTGNRAGGNNSFIGAGVDNLAGERAFVGGGEQDSAIGSHSVVGGGLNNKASHSWTTVSGGANNKAFGLHATIPGGRGNWASGQASLAAGAGARAVHNGSFVWADFDTTTSFSSTAESQFLIRASGGMGVGTDAPTEQLDVAGAIKVGDTTTGGSAGVLRWNGTEFQGHDGLDWTSLSAVGGSDNDWTIAGNGTDMYSAVSGNVGIGNSTPAAKLAVTGDLIVSEKATIGTANTNTGIYTFVAGFRNDAAGAKATISGGEDNVADGFLGAVGGGAENTVSISSHAGAIGGGENNLVSGSLSTIGGGSNNTASGNGATIPGGLENVAAANRSFAAGQKAQANHLSAFVWSDGDSVFASTADRQFLVRADGGVGINTNSPEEEFELKGNLLVRGIEENGALVVHPVPDGYRTFNASLVLQGAGGDSLNPDYHISRGAFYDRGTGTFDVHPGYGGTSSSIRLGSNGAIEFHSAPPGGWQPMFVATPVDTGNVNSFASLVGIGTPTPTEKLEVAGGIKVGAAINEAAGTIQWTGTDLQVHDGAAWINLSAAVGGNTLNQAYHQGGGGLGRIILATHGPMEIQDGGFGALRLADSVGGSPWDLDVSGSGDLALSGADGFSLDLGTNVDHWTFRNAGANGLELRPSGSTPASTFEIRSPNGTTAGVFRAQDNNGRLTVSDLVVAGRALGTTEVDTLYAMQLDVGTSNSDAILHVSGNGSFRGDHLAVFESTGGQGKDGILISVSPNLVSSENRFITFTKGGPWGSVVGAIEGFGPDDYLELPGGWLGDLQDWEDRDFAPPPPSFACDLYERGLLTTNPLDWPFIVLDAAIVEACMIGGVVLSSGSADYAEWLPKLDPDEKFLLGDIVGVYGGKVTKRTEGADQILAISTRPIVLGNQPPEGEEHLYERVGFLGQVPVLVKGAVHSGDYIVASGDGNGAGVAVAPENLRLEHLSQVVGRSWADSEAPLNYVNAVLGLKTDEWVGLLRQQADEITNLTARVAKLEERAEQFDQLKVDLAQIRQTLELGSMRVASNE